MSMLLALAAEAEHHGPGVGGLLIAGGAAALFVALGYVTWSYRDVAARHGKKTTSHGEHH